MANALDASVARRMPASAAVQQRDSGSVRFADRGNALIHGEAVYLSSAQAEEIIRKIDEFESASGYERVLVRINLGDVSVPAWAYQLQIRSGEPMKREEMLTAACRNC
jgi:gamma-glutamylcyclotransferase (GGCT)/AIG2-like uncharacterized protein YtfP